MTGPAGPQTASARLFDERSANPAKAGFPHLTADVSVAPNDFDISFYRGQPDPDCAQSANNRTPRGNRNGNESGFIPVTTTTALVYLDTGAAGDFTYRDGL